MKFGINQAISQTITQLSCIQLETPSSRLWNFWWIKTYTTFKVGETDHVFPAFDHVVAITWCFRVLRTSSWLLWPVTDCPSMSWLQTRPHSGYHLVFQGPKNLWVTAVTCNSGYHLVFQGPKNLWLTAVTCSRLPSMSWLQTRPHSGYHLVFQGPKNLWLTAVTCNRLPIHVMATD